MLSDDEKSLEKARNEREDNIVGITLDMLLGLIDDKKKELDAIIADCGRKTERERALIEALSTYLDESFDRYLAVPQYIQRQKACQDVYLFVGTHWKQIIYQQFIDFVRDCCHKTGLEDTYCGDSVFMNRLLEHLTFRRSRYRANAVPHGEVWINLSNGTLEIHPDGNVVFRHHESDDFFTYCLPYPYDADAGCPQWLAFLDRVIPEREMQQLLSEYVGYCFTKNMKLEKMAVFYGTGCNGKSVTMDVIEHVLGRENVSHVSLAAATTDDEKRMHLEGKLVNTSSESSKDIDAATLKQLVSGEPVNVRKLYVGSYVIYDYAKLITSFNQLPPAERTYGYYRRWLLFPFKVTIPEEEQDINLVHKLCGELPGIMNWVLSGLRHLAVSNTFTQSPLCTQALSEYQKRTNSALQFLTDRCEIDSMSAIKLMDLYSSYSLFCNEEGISNKMTKCHFKEHLESFGAKARTIHGVVYYDVKVN